MLTLAFILCMTALVLSVELSKKINSRLGHTSSSEH